MFIGPVTAIAVHYKGIRMFFFILSTGKYAETIHGNNTYNTVVDRAQVAKNLKPHV